MPPALGYVYDLCLFCYLIGPGKFHPLHHDPLKPFQSLQWRQSSVWSISSFFLLRPTYPSREVKTWGEIGNKCTQHSSFFFWYTDPLTSLRFCCQALRYLPGGSGRLCMSHKYAYVWFWVSLKKFTDLKMTYKPQESEPSKQSWVTDSLHPVQITKSSLNTDSCQTQHWAWIKQSPYTQGHTT